MAIWLFNLCSSDFMTQLKNLLVRLPNWVGDCVMALPALQGLHDAGFHLICLGKTWAKSLFSAYPWEIITNINEADAEMGLCFPDSFSSAWQMRAANIKPMGYRSDWRSLFLYKGFTRSKQVHQVEYYWNLAQNTSEFLQHPWPHAKIIPPQLQLTTAAHELATTILNQQAIQKPFWMLCPLAVGTIKGKSKVWPHWHELGERLHARGITVVTCPGPQEEVATQQVLPQAIQLPHLKLDAMAAVMQQAAQVIANDSGPMHIADAVGVPTLGIFGVANPWRTHPWSGRTIGDLRGWPGLTDVLRLVLPK